MPKVFEKNGYKFFFFANEGHPREPLHIHVRRGEKIAKFWLVPSITIDESFGFLSSELRWIEDEIRKNRDLIEERWYDFFGG
jgi:hypothetical protein